MMMMMMMMSSKQAWQHSFTLGMFTYNMAAATLLLSNDVTVTLFI